MLSNVMDFVCAELSHFTVYFYHLDMKSLKSIKTQWTFRKFQHNFR